MSNVIDWNESPLRRLWKSRQGYQRRPHQAAAYSMLYPLSEYEETENRDWETAEQVRIAIEDVLHNHNGKGIEPESVIRGTAKALFDYICDHLNEMD